MDLRGAGGEKGGVLGRGIPLWWGHLLLHCGGRPANTNGTLANVCAAATKFSTQAQRMAKTRIADCTIAHRSRSLSFRSRE